MMAIITSGCPDDGDEPSPWRGAMIRALLLIKFTALCPRFLHKPHQLQKAKCSKQAVERLFTARGVSRGSATSSVVADDERQVTDAPNGQSAP